MIFIPNYHQNHTKFNFSMIPVAMVIWYECRYSIATSMQKSMIPCSHLFYTCLVLVALVAMQGYGRVIIQPRKGIMPIYGFEANKITCMVPADYYPYIVLKFRNKTQFVQNKFNIHENITTIICKQGVVLVSMQCQQFGSARQPQCILPVHTGLPTIYYRRSIIPLWS